MKIFILSLFILSATASAHADINYQVFVKDFRQIPEGYTCSLYLKNLRAEPIRLAGVETAILTDNLWVPADSVWTIFSAQGLGTNNAALWMYDQIRVVAAVIPTDSLFVQPNEEKLLVTLGFNVNILNPRKTVPERKLMYIHAGGTIPNVSNEVELVIGDLTGVSPVTGNTPDDFSLIQNYPNPFNPTTKFEFSLPRSSGIEISVYDQNGRFVRNLVSGYLGSGSYSLDWNAADLPSGAYFVRMMSEGISITRRAILVK
ncbi:MAG: T9SS type A sorting domain-containing protein [Ignavibacteria bacterium]|nr:T9SS type A sorting domain-containing protein [Ignavibacteria bacterium]